MAEQLLDHAQIGAALEQVRRERVAQAVRVAEQAADRAGVESTTAGREEERVVRTLRERGPAVAQVAGEVVRGLLAERHDSFLLALSAQVHRLAVEVHVDEVERDGLGAAQPAGVEELEQGSVPKRER